MKTGPTGGCTRAATASLSFRTLIFPLVLCSLAIEQTAWAVFPQVESFENDTDTYTPSNDPYNDPDFGGDPPVAWNDLRTSRGGLIEEVPSGYDGVTASSGNFLGIVVPEGGDGPQGFPSFQTTPIASPWSYQMDIYTLGTVEPGLGVAQGGHGNGSNGVPDFWWTNAVNPNGVNDYLTETGFTAEVLDDGVLPRVWKLTTTTGGQPFFVAEIDTWYTLEVEYDTSQPQLQATHRIYNQAHTELLYSHTLTELFPHPPNEPQSSQLGGPRYSWFTFFEANLNRIHVDNLGVGPPIVLVPEPGRLLLSCWLAVAIIVGRKGIRR